MYFLAVALGNARQQGWGCAAWRELVPWQVFRLLLRCRGSGAALSRDGLLAKLFLLVSCPVGSKVTCGCVSVPLGVRASGAHER